MKIRVTAFIVLFSCSAASVNAQRIGAGTYCSFASCSDSVSRSWGLNSYGQLGDSSTTARSTPVSIYNLNSLLDFSGGFGHTVSLKSDSTVWTWGRNDYGGLGNGTTSGSIIPVQAIGLSGVKSISAGDFFSVALKSDSTVWSWGHNNNGQLGLGAVGNISSPQMVTAIDSVLEIAAGREYMLALRSDSTVWGWGLNDNGQLGTGSTIPSSHSVPVQAVGLDSITAISAGRYAFSVALKSDGTVWAWGNNQFGQLGNGNNTNSPSPVQVSGLSNIVAIARNSGYAHTLAVRSDGTVWSWGYNNNGQLGDSSNVNSNIPVQVRNLTDVVAVTCGDAHSIALKSDGSVWGWGYNASGQVGDGTILDKLVPVPVQGICPSTTSLSEAESILDLAVFPNPSSGKFEVKLAVAATEKLQLSISNLLGKNVYSASIEVGVQNKQLDLEGFPKGIYLLNLEGRNGIVSRKVCVQ